MNKQPYWEYTLSETVRLGDREISEIKFHKPRTKDVMRTDGYVTTYVGADVALASALSGESESLIAEILIDDWAEIRVELGKIWKIYFGVKKPSNPIVAAPEQTQVLEAASL